MANEKRLIDANAFLEEALKRYTERERCRDLLYTACEVKQNLADMICEAPTVDAVEVVHGRWKYYHKQNIAACTNCSFERNLDANFGKAVSCPNCGAKMDGD